MVERTSTFAQYNRSIADFSRLQTELAKVQQQISSGRKASTFKELGTDLTNIIGLENNLTASQKFIDSNDLVVSRIELMDLAISQLEGVARDLKSNLVIEQSSGNVFDITSFAQNSLQVVRDNLNLKQNGRSLFSGGKTNVDAVGDLRNISNVINNSSTAIYYKGDSQAFSIKASENLELEYGLKANDKAFQDLIAGFNKAKEYEISGNNNDFVAASNFVDSALEGLVTLRGSLNSDRITLNSATDQHGRVIMHLQQVLGDEIGVDIVEATIKSSLTEATLTASLQTFARISKLTLSDFLR